MATEGYPGSYEKGAVIEGLGEAESIPHVQIFHAGTEKRGKDIVATGGRVLSVAATGKTVVKEAQERAYRAVSCHTLEGVFQP